MYLALSYSRGSSDSSCLKLIKSLRISGISEAYEVAFLPRKKRGVIHRHSKFGAIRPVSKRFALLTCFDRC